MDDTSKFIIPNFKKKKAPKVIEKELLSVVNREVKCAYCGDIKILNPRQYQKRFDYFGSEDLLCAHFMCQPCESKSNINPFLFWFEHNPIVNNMANLLNVVFDDFVLSKISVEEFIKRNNEILHSSGIFPPNYELMVEDGKPTGFKINFPFVGNVELRPFKYNIKEKIKIVS